MGTVLFLGCCGQCRGDMQPPRGPGLPPPREPAAGAAARGSLRVTPKMLRAEPGAARGQTMLVRPVKDTAAHSEGHADTAPQRAEAGASPVPQGPCTRARAGRGGAGSMATPVRLGDSPCALCHQLLLTLQTPLCSQGHRALLTPRIPRQNCPAPATSPWSARESLPDLLAQTLGVFSTQPDSPALTVPRTHSFDDRHLLGAHAHTHTHARAHAHTRTHALTHARTASGALCSISVSRPLQRPLPAESPMVTGSGLGFLVHAEWERAPFPVPWPKTGALPRKAVRGQEGPDTHSRVQPTPQPTVKPPRGS